MNIGDRIKKRRLELGLSVDEVAGKLNKNRATVYRYESAEIEKLPIDILEPLSTVLKTTPAYLMGWENEESVSQDNHEYLNCIGRMIHDRRIALGLTLEEVGDLVGISRSAVQKYEKGIIKNINISIVEEFSKVLRCSPAYLMGWEGKNETNFSAKDLEILKLLSSLPADKLQQAIDYLRFLAASADADNQ